MENELLQPLLKAGLIDIGDSDERLANIEKSIIDLQEKLRLDPHLLLGFTLVALDPNISDADNSIIETETIIANHWRALRAKFSERPIPLIRAVIINALYNLGTSDAKIARVIYLTAVNFFPYSKLGREKEAVEKLLTDLGNIAEDTAVKEWLLGSAEPQLKLTGLKLSAIKFEAAQVGVEELKTSLRKAIGQEINGHTTAHSGDSAWGDHFAATASVGIAKSIDDSLEKLSSSMSPTSIETPINKFFGEFKKSLDEVLKTSFNSLSAVERRSKLLWWKETLYSTSIKNSYRTLNNSVQPVIMANDLYQQLPAVTPVSVDFLLRDSLRAVNLKSDDKMSFLDLLTNLTESKNKELLSSYFEHEEIVGRISITHFIGLAIMEKLPISSLKERTGIDPSEQLSFEDLSVAILHDLMAEHLI